MASEKGRKAGVLTGAAVSTLPRSGCTALVPLRPSGLVRRDPPPPSDVVVDAVFEPRFERLADHAAGPGRELVFNWGAGHGEPQVVDPAYKSVAAEMGTEPIDVRDDVACPVCSGRGKALHNLRTCPRCGGSGDGW